VKRMRRDEQRNCDAGVDPDDAQRRPASIKPNRISSVITVSPVATGIPPS
jgi:hypothetical protein